MPTFRFKGFTTASAVALTLTQGSASDTFTTNSWGDNGGVLPTASLSIERVDNTAQADIVAPYGCWLRATNLVGFAVTEPGGDTNVYDPSQHRMTYEWFLPDEGYSPILTPNIPNVWRTFTRDRGKQIAVTFTTPGKKEVTCFAFDEEGRWAFATYVFSDDAADNPDDPAIRDPNTFFSDDETIVIAKDGIFTGAPSTTVSANRQSTIGGLKNRIQNRYNAGFRRFRVLFKRGETWTNEEFSVNPSGIMLYIDAWGSGARPIWNQITVDGPFAFNSGASKYCVLANQDMRGDWDPTTETGRRVNGTAGTGSGWYKGSMTPLLIYRSRWSGFEQIQLNREAGDGKLRILFDTEVTNWRSFGIFSTSAPQGFATIWCDLHQHEDALLGCNLSEFGNSGDPNFGNAHGPYRGDSWWLHSSRTSWFARGGWSQGPDRTFVDRPPCAGQPVFRYQGQRALTNRAYINLTMSTFESDGDMFRHARFPGDDQNQFTCARNFVYDSNIICATGHSHSWFSTDYVGHTIRNNYFIRPDVAQTYTPNNGVLRGSVIGWSDESWTSTPIDFEAPDRVYNNTVLYLGPSSNINSVSDPDPQPSMVAAQIATRPPRSEFNNVVHCPDFTTPVGASFAPLGSSAVAGFVPRWKGDRWNFPPIGLTPAQVGRNITLTATDGSGATITVFRNSVGDARERETGIAGAVPDWGDDPDAGWCKIPYPSDALFATVCKGTLASALSGSTLRTLILANSTQKHQVSIWNQVNPFNPSDAGFRCFGDTDLWPQADGRVKIEFAADGIRIQNRTGSAWPETRPITERVSGITRPFNDPVSIFMLLDLSDYLMDFVSGTANPATIPAAIPGTGSAAKTSTALDPPVHGSLLLVEREGNVRTNGTTVSGGSHYLGAFAAS